MSFLIKNELSRSFYPLTLFNLPKPIVIFGLIILDTYDIFINLAFGTILTLKSKLFSRIKPFIFSFLKGNLFYFKSLGVTQL